MRPSYRPPSTTWRAPVATSRRTKVPLSSMNRLAGADAGAVMPVANHDLSAGLRPASRRITRPDDASTNTVSVERLAPWNGSSTARTPGAVSETLATANS